MKEYKYQNLAHIIVYIIIRLTCYQVPCICSFLSPKPDISSNIVNSCYSCLHAYEFIYELLWYVTFWLVDPCAAKVSLQHYARQLLTSSCYLFLLTVITT